MSTLRCPVEQARAMVDTHGCNYKFAIDICRQNIKLYSGYPRVSHEYADWWREVRNELKRMQKTHCETDSAYYKTITSEEELQP